MTARPMHEGEVQVHAKAVRRLVGSQFPQWAHLPVARLPSSGTDNALFRLGATLLVRMPRIDWAAADVEREHEWLPRLGPRLPVSVPTPIAIGEPGEGYPWRWSVYTWLDGANPAAGLPDADGLARDLARFVTALRRVDVTGAPRAARGEPLPQRDEATRASLRALSGLVDVPAVSRVWDHALRAPAWDGEPVWIHGDLAPGNVLLVDGRLSAVIDFGGAGLGDPACDLMVAWNLLAGPARAAFGAAAGVDEAIWQRGVGWALSVALIQLPYYADTNPALAAVARRVVSEVLAASD
jgi:aminoglycoside phosphotransferase (APT) family kinase protein